MLLLAGGCARATDPTVGAAPTQSAPDLVMTQETIRSNAVGRLGSARVGVGNIYERSSDGPPAQSGLSAQLFPPDRDAVTVWPGDVVEVGGTRWTVVSVDKPAGERGSVTLAPAAD
jgi:Family of unknown function (DUF6406)